ncbi:MAG: transcription initiation factor IIB [Candidatus Thorarchaeota archaeon]|jgi:transcription initiation factor TFIIB
MVEQLNESTKKSACPNCGAQDFHMDRVRGEQVCTACGSVLSSNIIDPGPEWRSFTAEEYNARARTGSPANLMLPDKGLSTVIGWTNKDASGRSISGSRRAQIFRLRKWQRRSISSQTDRRNLSLALTDMNRIASQLGIPQDIKETASKVYRVALSKKLIRGKSISSMVAASLYIACRIHKVPRRLDEVTKEAGMDRYKLGKSVRHILRYTGIKLPVPSAIYLVPRISSEIGMSGNAVKEAISIITRAVKSGITAGKDPGGIAAAALYIAGVITENRFTQREIAEAACVTEVTIRNRYKELVLKLNLGNFQ